MFLQIRNRGGIDYEMHKEKWRTISLAGILLGNGALLMDRFVIRFPNVIIIPILLIAIILIFAGIMMRKKQKKME